MISKDQIDSTNIDNIFTEALDASSFLLKQEDGMYVFDRPLSDMPLPGEDSLSSILSDTNPTDAFYDWYDEVIGAEYGESLSDLVFDVLEFFQINYADQYDKYNHLFDLEYMAENRVNNSVVCGDYIEAILHSQIDLVVLINTGDANNDYNIINLENMLDNINARSPLIWLAEQQGYNLNQFRECINNRSDSSTGLDPFIMSVFNEIENCTSNTGQLTFLLRCNLEDALAICGQLNSVPHSSLPVLNSDYGSIVISSSSTCGLFDANLGSGSSWGIKLKKDLCIPLSLICQFNVDCAVRPYSPKEVFGRNSLDFASGFVRSYTLHEPVQLSAHEITSDDLVIVDGVCQGLKKGFVENMSLGAYHVIIPEGVRGIADKAFKSIDMLTKLSLPSSLTFIGDEAFSGTAIDELVLPEGLCLIGNAAFTSTRFTEVSFPKSLRKIGSHAFYSTCLNSVTINSQVIIGAHAFTSSCSLSVPNSDFSITYENWLSRCSEER